MKQLLLLSPAPPTRQHFQQRFWSFAKRDSAGQARLAQLRRQLESSGHPALVCREILDINKKLYANPKNIRKKKGNYCDVPEDAFRKQAITARHTLQSMGNYDVRPLLRNIIQPSLVIEGAKHAGTLTSNAIDAF